MFGVAGCEAVTQSESYRTYSGICNECPTNSGLKRPVCPNTDDHAADRPSDAGTYYFAWRTVAFGDKSYDGGDDDVGFDEDCADDSPRLTRALCVAAPLPADNGTRAIPVPQWARLPGGIENALGQRVIKPLIAYSGGAFDVDVILSQAFSGGTAGQIVVLEDWNGLPDDNAITVAFVGTNGLDDPDAGPPRWDGTDVWRPKSDPSAYPHYQGYVSGGILVADTRGVGDEKLDIALTDSTGTQQTFHIQTRLMTRVGVLDQTHLSLTNYGRWDLAEALENRHDIARFLAGGDNTVDGGNGLFTTLDGEFEELFRGAADLPFTGSTEQDLGGDISAPCTAMSLALKAEAYPVKVAPAQ